MRSLLLYKSLALTKSSIHLSDWYNWTVNQDAKRSNFQHRRWAMKWDERLKGETWWRHTWDGPRPHSWYRSTPPETLVCMKEYNGAVFGGLGTLGTDFISSRPLVVVASCKKYTKWRHKALLGNPIFCSPNYWPTRLRTTCKKINLKGYSAQSDVRLAISVTCGQTRGVQSGKAIWAPLMTSGIARITPPPVFIAVQWVVCHSVVAWFLV